MYIFFDDLNIFIFKSAHDVKKIPFEKSSLLDKVDKNAKIIVDRNDFSFSFDELKNCSALEKYKIIKCARQNQHEREENLIFDSSPLKHSNCLLQKIVLDTQDDLYTKLSCGFTPIEFLISKVCKKILEKNAQMESKWWIYLARHNSAIRLVAGFNEGVIISRFFYENFQKQNIVETLNYMKRFGAPFSGHLFFDRNIKCAQEFLNENSKAFVGYNLGEAASAVRNLANAACDFDEEARQNSESVSSEEFPVKFILENSKKLQPIFKLRAFVLQNLQNKIFKVMSFFCVLAALLCGKLYSDVYFSKVSISTLKNHQFEIPNKSGLVVVRLNYENLESIKDFLNLVSRSQVERKLFLKVSRCLPEILRVDELLYEKESLKLRLKISDEIPGAFLKADFAEVLNKFLEDLRLENLSVEILDDKKNIVVLIK